MKHSIDVIECFRVRPRGRGNFTPRLLRIATPSKASRQARLENGCQHRHKEANKCDTDGGASSSFGAMPQRPFSGTSIRPWAFSNLMIQSVGLEFPPFGLTESR